MAYVKKKGSVAGRLKRYARVSTAMAGYGAHMAGSRLGVQSDRKKRARMLREALGSLKGPLMKVAQILSTIPDAVPPEYTAELSQLQADAPSMGWPFVKRRMAAELGADWEKKFAGFDRTASAAASLGQVHKARLPDGTAVACKLQYPDMDSAVEADLRQLKLVLQVFERYDRAVSTKQVHAEIAARLHEELDYELEAKHIKLYRAMLAGVEAVHVPDVFGKFSTTRLLTMSWLEGERLVHAAETRPLKDRNEIAMNMFRAWYTPFYNYGIIHGDPHMGNYSICKDNSLNLLDFGCVRIFPASLITGVIDLYHALQDDDEARAIKAYEAWGFHKPGKELINVLNIWARFIYAPILEDKKRAIEETNTGLYGRETANKVHAELRKIGGVEVPREFVFMDRAAIGLGAVFLRLGAEVNWCRMFHALIDGYNEQKLAGQQARLLRQSGLEAGS
ncbi:MAG: AarF/ABC1/UbiB kinase family protein [Alphaproteobacteria bacterium]|nr:AarF/ABC1/UbiB kinase family protein [Alphaproteobacteria bacterium]